MSAGIQRFSSGSRSLIRCTVSMTLASESLVMISNTEGWPLNQLAERLLRTPCSTDAICDSRTTSPLAALTTSVSYSRGCCSCALVPMVAACAGPSKAPTGPIELALEMVLRTCSMEMPVIASAAGLTRTRTAGCSAPLTVTSPTPSVWEMRCASTLSATSYMALGAMVLEVRARIRTGEAAGLNFRKVGRFGRSVGRSLRAALSAACTSRAAPSILRLRSNCTVIRLEPSELRDVSSVTPAISPSRRSSGAAMVAAMVSGSAPGRLAETLMVGSSTAGRLATGRKR